LSQPSATPTPAPSLAPTATPSPSPTATATASSGPIILGSAKKANDGEIVAALDTQLREAVKTNDAPAIGRILAEDFVLINGRARPATKADLIKAAQEKSVIYEHQEELKGTQTVRLYGDTAVVTAVLWIKGIDGGNPIEYQLCLSDTYLRTPEGWRDAFCQASLPPPKPPPAK
jgi:ketosteroid isomerase-like protein